MPGLSHDVWTKNKLIMLCAAESTIKNWLYWRWSDYGRQGHISGQVEARPVTQTHHRLDWDTWHSGELWRGAWLLLCAASSLIKWKSGCILCCCWGIAQVRATCFSAYHSDSVPTAACSAAAKWGVCLRGALLIFTDGNNSAMVMNGAA